MPLWWCAFLPMHESFEKPSPLVVAEIKEVSGGLFEAARCVYWIINKEDKSIIRGGHYHPYGGKEEIMVCLTGFAKIELHSSKGCGTVDLENFSSALVIPNGVWHRITLSPSAILLSIASTNFAANECYGELPCACPLPRDL